MDLNFVRYQEIGTKVLDVQRQLFVQRQDFEGIALVFSKIKVLRTLTYKYRPNFLNLLLRYALSLENRQHQEQSHDSGKKNDNLTECSKSRSSLRSLTQVINGRITYGNKQNIDPTVYSTCATICSSYLLLEMDRLLETEILRVGYGRNNLFIYLILVMTVCQDLDHYSTVPNICNRLLGK